MVSLSAVELIIGKDELFSLSYSHTSSKFSFFFANISFQDSVCLAVLAIVVSLLGSLERLTRTHGKTYGFLGEIQGADGYIQSPTWHIA